MVLVISQMLYAPDLPLTLQLENDVNVYYLTRVKFRILFACIIEPNPQTSHDIDIIVPIFLKHVRQQVPKYCLLPCNQ